MKYATAALSPAFFCEMFCFVYYCAILLKIIVSCNARKHIAEILLILMLYKISS